MSTVKTKKVQLGTDATASNNFTLYQPSTPDGTLRIGVGNADSPTEVGRFNSNGYVATNAPAFSAYKTGSQSVSDATFTKVTFDTERFDTNGAYDNTTNYRFTPQVAGYYQVNYTIRMQGGTITTALMALYKNSVRYETGPINRENTTSSVVITSSALVYLNGSTDYIEIYGYCDVSAGSPTFDGNAGSTDTCYFSAHLVRAA